MNVNNNLAADTRGAIEEMFKQRNGEFGNMEEMQKVERCAAGYSSSGLSYVIYRILNAVKAIFGQSDWQIANEHSRVDTRPARMQPTC